MTELFYFNIGGINHRTYRKILGLLPESRRTKAEGYYFTKDRYLSAGAGYLLHSVLKERGIDYSSAKIEIGENGKPRLCGENVFFNLSHSGKMALCAVSDGEVGADIQSIRSVGKGVLDRVFTNKEAAVYSSLPDSRKADYFFYVWAKKESVMKYFGLGLALPFKDIETACGGISVRGAVGNLCCKEYFLSGYKIFACSGKNDFSESLTEIILR